MPKSKTRAAEKDAITLLKEDHKKIRVLLGELEETSTRAAEMFPRARKLMGRQKLLELHDRLAEAKTSLTEGVLTKLVELVRPS